MDVAIRIERVSDRHEHQKESADRKCTEAVTHSPRGVGMLAGVQVWVQCKNVSARHQYDERQSRHDIEWSPHSTPTIAQRHTSYRIGNTRFISKRRLDLPGVLTHDPMPQWVEVNDTWVSIRAERPGAAE